MNNYFCVMAFYGAVYDLKGNQTPCCFVPTNVDVAKIQADMLVGERPKACKHCWHLEDQGKISDRQIKNQTFDFYKHKDLRFIEEECRAGKFSPQIVQLHTSHLCNSTCVTCGPGASSAWDTLKKVKILPVEHQAVRSIDFKEVVMLSFAGGEPLYERRNFEILEKLLSAGNTNCFISITTNGSVTLSDNQINLLRKFKHLDFCLSIDGIGSTFEYLRYPLKWNTLLSNIKLYRELGVNLSISYTISNLNVLEYDKTVSWFNEQGFSYNHNIVHRPEFFHPSILPNDIKDQHPNLKEFFRDHNENLLEQCITELDIQDQLKGINIADYRLEFYNQVIKRR